jgi:competence protein ComEA
MVSAVLSRFWKVYMRLSSPVPLPVDANTTPSAAEAPVPLNRLPVLFIQWFALGFLSALLTIGLFVLMARRPDPPAIELQPPPTPLPTATPIPTATPAPIVVFVSGSVTRPGLYTLPSDARVGDALAAAGGLREEAAGDLINQAERLWDGAQVHVPSVLEAQVGSEPAPGVSGASQVAPVQSTTEQGGRININTASAEALITLPGIGTTKAAAIIAGRPYATVEDLERVSGIGAKTIEQLRDLVTVE